VLISDAVREYFSQPLDIELNSKDGVVDLDLTYYNIERMSGIETTLTDNSIIRILSNETKSCACSIMHHS
jgi:hypothetical protein